MVYDGPSRTGKSESALSRFTEEKQKMKCQSVQIRNLHEILTGMYSAVLDVECTWALFGQSAKLFQVV